MRLINARTLEVQEFSLVEVPPYAILSHTWGEGEVSFEEISLPSRVSKNGFEKIAKTCQLARGHGLEFAWVDTCCIDKSSSAELTESMNSMWQYYLNAAICYVSLQDLPPDIPIEDGLAHCRWFTRGWTLQELLAPKKLEFYDMSWNYRGSKHDFVQTISDVARIPIEILRGQDAPADYSVAMKMSWAARRKTTRVEDMAYCLLGIFDVNMPLIYGKGMKAFRRLQEEIVKRKNDLTIFAWNALPGQETQILALFATSPEAFADSSDIIPFDDDFSEYSVTNKGLPVSGDIPMRIADVSGGQGGREVLRYLIVLGTRRGKFERGRIFERGGIYLRKVGPKLFYRDGMFPLADFGLHQVEQKDFFFPTGYHILIDPHPSVRILSSKHRDFAIHIPDNHLLRLTSTFPEILWDHTDRVFLRPSTYPWSSYPMALAMKFRCIPPPFINVFNEYGDSVNDSVYADTGVDIVVLCDYRETAPTCKVFEAPSQAGMVFLDRYRNDSINWEELELQAPDIVSLNNRIVIRDGARIYTVSISFEMGRVERISEHETFHSLFSLKVAIT
jgi:hypothetical protein